MASAGNGESGISFFAAGLQPPMAKPSELMAAAPAPSEPVIVYTGPTKTGAALIAAVAVGRAKADVETRKEIAGGEKACGADGRAKDAAKDAGKDAKPEAKSAAKPAAARHAHAKPDAAAKDAAPKAGAKPAAAADKPAAAPAKPKAAEKPKATEKPKSAEKPKAAAKPKDGEKTKPAPKSSEAKPADQKQPAPRAVNRVSAGQTGFFGQQCVEPVQRLAIGRRIAQYCPKSILPKQGGPGPKATGK